MNLEQLTPYQLETLIDLAQQLVNVKVKRTGTHHEIIEEEEATVSKCPHCGALHFIKYGHRNGVQRYLCKDCKTTFGATNKTFLFYTHSTYETWIHFIACELLHFMLKETAIGMSKTNCFHMKHKFYGALQS